MLRVTGKKMRQQLYGFIVDDIIEKIKHGQLKPDEKLSTERELSEKYNVNQSTVKKALKELIKLGYIFSVERIGNYVCPPNLDTYTFNYDRKIIDNIAVTSYAYKQPVILDCSDDAEFPANASAAVFFKISKCENIIVCYEKRYVFFRKGLTKTAFSSESNAILELMDKFTVSSTLDIFSLYADEQLSEESGFKLNAPVFCVRKKDFDGYGKIFCINTAYYRFDSFTVSSTSDN